MKVLGKRLSIVSIADGYMLIEDTVYTSDYLTLEAPIALREKLGEAYSYPSRPDTVIGFVREYFEEQQKARETPEPNPEPPVTPSPIPPTEFP